MRYQEPKYIRSNNSALRNKDIINVTTSSDMCTFTRPEYIMSGTTKIPYNELTCELSGVSYSDILSGSTGSCDTVIYSASCIDDITWSVNVSEDSTIVFSSDFFTQDTLSGTTPTNTDLTPILSGGFATLGYTFTNVDDTFVITKPYGTTQLDVDVCITYNQTDGCYSGTCSTDCTNVCSEVFDNVNSGSTGVYIISGDTNFDVKFDFTVNDSLIYSDFKFEIYEYVKKSSLFRSEPTYVSETYQWSDYSGTSAITETIYTNTLTLDNDFLIKGYFKYDVCTEFMGLLGKIINTENNKSGDKFGIYNTLYDYFFIVMTEAQTPIFNLTTPKNTVGVFSVHSIETIDGQTTYPAPNDISSGLVVALNGLTLSVNYDYTYTIASSGSTIELVQATVSGDMITYSYMSENTGSLNKIKIDVYDISSTILSGSTDGEGSENVYLNTDTGKYEIFTSVTPRDGDSVSISLNGVTLANSIDFYQSITNPKRIILEGNILVGDIISLYYPVTPDAVGLINSLEFSVGWVINIEPRAENGVFTLEVSSDESFSIILYSNETDYVINQKNYKSNLAIGGTYGDNLYYRIKNEKFYESINGDLISDVAYSEIIPITLNTNKNNSY